MLRTDWELSRFDNSTQIMFYPLPTCTKSPLDFVQVEKLHNSS